VNKKYKNDYELMLSLEKEVKKLKERNTLLRSMIWDIIGELRNEGIESAENWAKEIEAKLMKIKYREVK